MTPSPKPVQGRSKRVDIAELLAGDDFHYRDCPEYVGPGGDYEGDSRFMEPRRLCDNDCIWHRVDEAVEEIQRLRKKLVRAHSFIWFATESDGRCSCGALLAGTWRAEAKRQHAAHVKRVAR